MWNFFTKVSIPNVPAEFKTVCGVCKTEYEMHTGWGTGTMARHLETHGILKDSGISLKQAQISGFPGAKPGAGMFFYNRKKMIDEFSRYVVLDEKPFVMGARTILYTVDYNRHIARSHEVHLRKRLICASLILTLNY